MVKSTARKRLIPHSELLRFGIYRNGEVKMVNYYYARKEKEEDGVKYLEVPVIVNPETAKANNQHYSMVKIGYRQYPCVFEWIPENYYNTHKCMLEQEAKEDERDSRCLVPDPRKMAAESAAPNATVASVAPTQGN